MHSHEFASTCPIEAAAIGLSSNSLKWDDHD